MYIKIIVRIPGNQQTVLTGQCMTKTRNPETESNPLSGEHECGKDGNGGVLNSIAAMFIGHAVLWKVHV